MKSLDLIGAFDEYAFPDSRIATLDTLAWGRKRQHVPILLELDVTTARTSIRCLKEQTGETISFTAWMIVCLAQAISEHPYVQAMRKGNRRLVLFHDVDVAIIIERAVAQTEAQQTLPMPYILRKANEKYLADIHAELRAAQHAPITASDTQISTPRATWMNRLFLRLPTIARDLLVWRRLQRDPLLAKRMMGTVSVTALGMHGGIGWGIPIGIHPLIVAVGGIAQRPAIVHEQLVMREHVGLTVLFDHAVTDGAPVARFIARLQELVEAGYGLADTEALKDRFRQASPEKRSAYGVLS